MPQALDRPPMLPPNVTSQMGAQGGGSGDPLAAIGSAMQGGSGASGAPAPPQNLGAANAQGALVAMMEPVEKVLTHMVRVNARMQPYVKRALAILQSGMQDAQSSAPGGQQDTPDSTTGASDSSPDASMSIPA